MLFSWSDTVVYFFKPTLYPFFVLSAVHSESIEAFLHIVQFMHESLGLTGGHHFFSPQCSKTQKGHLYLGCRRTWAAGSFTVQWISKQANWFYLCFTQCTKALLSLQHIFELFQVINLRWRIENWWEKDWKGMCTITMRSFHICQFGLFLEIFRSSMHSHHSLQKVYIRLRGT